MGGKDTARRLSQGLERVGRAAVQAWTRWRGPALAGLPMVQGLAVVALAGVCLVPLQARRAADDRASPALREAMVSGGFLSEAGLRLIQADMGPGGRAAVKRFYARGRGPDPDRPAGWRMFALQSVPSLGLGDLTAEDARTINAAIPDSPLPVERGRAFHGADLATASGQRALYCLTQAIYFEAGRDDERAQSAVAQVVLNRVRHPAYPHSVCGVVYQGALRSTGCQFSFTCDGSLQRGVMVSAWNRAQTVARRALSGFVMPEVGVSTNYHADYVAPYWAATLVKIAQVGPHIFYRWTGPLGQRSALNQHYDGNETNIAHAVLASLDERVQGLEPVVPLQEDDGGGVRPSRAAIASLQMAGLVAEVADGKVHALLNPVARKPSADEIRAINEKLAAFESGLSGPAKAAEAAVTASPP